jgi:glycosyltransferase involved in cell wall biosynthesis
MDRPIVHINLSKSFRGGERQTELLVRGLAERDHPQRLVARAGAPLAERLADVARLDIRGVSGLLGAARACGSDATLLHVHEGRAPLVARGAQLLGGTPYVITRRVPKALKRNPVTRHLYRRAARIVAISQAVAESLADYDPCLRVDVIPSALARLAADPAALARLHARHTGRFVVGHVGALVIHHKAQDLLIDVARRVQHVHPDILFVFVGDGEDGQRLRSLAADLFNVEFAGFVDDVGTWLEAFDLLTLPSRHEGLGSVLLDAMDHGKAIVATRVGGIPEVVADGDNGLLVAPDSADELERAILTLYRDRARLAAMGERSRTRAAAYTPVRMTERYVELYRSVQEEARA